MNGNRGGINFENRKNIVDSVSNFGIMKSERR